MKHVRTAVTALGLALGLAVSIAPAASADGPVGDLTLEIRSLIGAPYQEYTLTCEPTGGTHPFPDAACADLIAANGDVSAIPPVTASCPAFAPIIVDITGTWAGQEDRYTGKFTSWCAANAATGGHVLFF